MQIATPVGVGIYYLLVPKVDALGRVNLGLCYVAPLGQYPPPQRLLSLTEVISSGRSDQQNVAGNSENGSYRYNHPTSVTNHAFSLCRDMACVRICAHYSCVESRSGGVS